ncbi:MAG: twin-arginine translocation signal domain-containing protein [Sphingobium sp.]|nr:twin-arginine translocation signal domain-containing protein [Sphingobium sp.]
MIRRDFLRTGGAVALAAVLPNPARAGASAKPPLAMFDGRYSDARLFAEAARGRGALVLDTGGDVASLWHTARFPRDEATTMIGLTTYADLFMISELARGLNLRRGFHAMHDARGGSEVRHLPENAMFPAPDFRAAIAWPIMLADCLIGEPGRSVSLPRSGPRSADHPGTLWSWMYGPLNPQRS